MNNPVPDRPRTLTRRALLHRGALLGAAAAAAPGLAACGGRKPGRAAPAVSAQPVRGGTLTLRISTDALTLDHVFSHDVVSSFVIFNCVEPLVTVDPQAQPVGLLATSWEIPDPQTYIFKLRQGVKFQDGTPLNAAAVAYSLNRTYADKTAFHYADLAAVASIETPDAATVKINLSTPFAPFLYKLTDNEGRVTSPAAGEKLGDKRKADLTGQGSGPFSFVEWRPDDHITLIRNPGYWGRVASGDVIPYLDRLIMRPIPDRSAALASLRNGEIDGFQPNSVDWPASQDVPGIKGDPSLSFKTAPGMNYFYTVFNEARPPFNNKAVRQAVSYAVDRGAIATDFFRGTVEPWDAIFTPSTWAADPSYHPYLKRDVAKAKQLLAQAGLSGGFRFDYLIVAGDTSTQQLAELMKDELSEAGITVNIKPIAPPALLQALSAPDHQAGFLSLSAGYDPDDWVYNYFSSKGALIQRSNYSNPDVDRLLDQARTTLDQSQRKSLYQQAQRQIIDDAAICVLYTKNAFSLTTAKVHNAPIGPTPAVGMSQVWKT